jgi:membrane-associated phospholipid phosphatase
LLDINKNHSPFLDDFMKGLSNSAAYVTFTIPIGIGIYGLAKNQNAQKENSMYMISSVLFSSAFTYALKDIVQRTRPNHAHIAGLRVLENENSYSFPSGHATGAFAFATSLTLAYPKWYVAVPAYAFAGLVAYSRPYLGVHYPSDILAGAVIGSGVSIGLYYAKKKWLDPLTKKKNSESK